MEERIRALETALTEERNARQLLEEELLVLFERIDVIGNSSAAQVAASVAESGSQAIDTSPRPDLRRSNDDRFAAARTEMLVQAGFAPERAEWIRRREDELRVEAMQARFEAQRSGDIQALMTAGRNSETALHAELGDQEYERYLEAYNRPTSVTVGSVLESSPGQRAGLQVGDQIVRYDGQRVFNYTEINNLQLQGEFGESVVVDVMRDGTLVQMVMPRGPIGIQASGFSRRRP